MSSSLFELAGRTALITGSSRGIGRTLAEGLAAAGARIVLNGVNAERLEGSVAECRQCGMDAHGRAFDVTDSAAIDAAIENIETDIGPIDILINNAGIQRRFPVLECSDETFLEVMQTNLGSVFKVSRAVGRHMTQRGRGKIVNIGSIQSQLGRPSIAPYAASKGGVAMLTKNLCAEWAPLGVQVNGLCPGYFATELTEALVDDAEFSGWVAKRTPAGRWGDVSELVGAAVFLSSDGSNFVNGHMLYVDGGMSAVV